MAASGLVPGAERGIRQEVRARVRGSFERAYVSVAEHTIPLGPGGEGRATVILDPTVDVRLLLFAPVNAEFSFAVSINGRTVTGRGPCREGKTTRTFRFRLADFGLEDE